MEDLHSIQQLQRNHMQLLRVCVFGVQLCLTIIINQKLSSQSSNSSRSRKLVRELHLKSLQKQRPNLMNVINWRQDLGRNMMIKWMKNSNFKIELPKQERKWIKQTDLLMDWKMKENVRNMMLTTLLCWRVDWLVM